MTIPEVRKWRLTREIGSLRPDIAKALMSSVAMVDKRLAVMAYPRAVGHQSPGFALLDWNNYHRLIATCNEHSHTYFAVYDHGDGIYGGEVIPAPVLEVQYSAVLGEYWMRMPRVDYVTADYVQAGGLRVNSAGLVGPEADDFVVSGSTANFLLWVDASENKVLFGGQWSTTYVVNGGKLHCEDAELKQIRILSGGGIISDSSVDIIIAPAHGHDDADVVLGSLGRLRVGPGGHISPASSADTDAPNGSIYYSTDASKLVFKDAGGTVNELY